MSDDLIKRSDAIKTVSKVDDYGDGIGFEVRSHCLVELELVPSADRPQDDDFKNFDRESLILLIECQKERIGELLADRQQGEKCNE